MTTNFEKVLDEHQDIMEKAFALLDESAKKIELLMKLKEMQAQVINIQSDRIALLEEKCKMLEERLVKSGRFPGTSD